MKISDGGFQVSKEAIIAISFILLLLGALIPYVSSQALIVEKVAKLEAEFEEAGPRHTEIIKEMEKIDTLNSTQIELLKQKLDTISANIAEMKADIKEIKNELNIK